MRIPVVAMVAMLGDLVQATAAPRASAAPARPSAPVPKPPLPKPVPLPVALAKKPKGVTITETPDGELWLECSECGLVAVGNGASIIVPGRGNYQLANPATVRKVLEDIQVQHRESCAKLMPD